MKNNDEEISKALYNEAISILKYNLSIIYPSMTEIFDVLKKNVS